MRLKISITIDPEVFTKVTHVANRQGTDIPVLMSYYVIARTRIEEGQFVFVEDYHPASNLQSLLSVGTIATKAQESAGGENVGYIFYSSYKVRNVGSAIAAYTQHSTTEGAVLLLRADLFNLYGNQFVTAAVNGSLASTFEQALTQLV